jgi:predicted NBD/HSP70 family sugar kinase
VCASSSSDSCCRTLHQDGSKIGGHVTRDRLEQAIAGAEQGKAELQAVFAEAGAVLGQELANVCNLLNPARVILAGSGVRAGDLLLKPP